MYCYRSSQFIPFVDIAQYPKQLAKGGVGDAMLDDSLIKMVKSSQETVDYTWLGVNIMEVRFMATSIVMNLLEIPKMCSDAEKIKVEFNHVAKER